MDSKARTLISNENYFIALNQNTMATIITSAKKEKSPEVESQKIVKNHEKAALHHEKAAKLHREAAKFQKEGNSTMACGCNCKAKNETDLAKKIQKKNQKKQSQFA
jgi:hypothetical protein